MQTACATTGAVKPSAKTTAPAIVDIFATMMNLLIFEAPRGHDEQFVVVSDMRCFTPATKGMC
jgi:hypothetical protein